MYEKLSETEMKPGKKNNQANSSAQVIIKPHYLEITFHYLSGKVVNKSEAALSYAMQMATFQTTWPDSL